MTVAANGLLSDLEARGVTVTVTPEWNLYCEPRAVLDEKIIEKILLHKEDLLTILAPPPRFVRKEQERASALGLVAKWSREFGYISIHDPVEGEWHDAEMEDAPDWAKREAFKRKELWKSGNKRAFDLTAREMEELWEEEQVDMWDHPAVTEKGIVYEDYLEEE